KEYRARFSNACGNNVATTAATLTLNSAPVVTLNPASQTICPGSVTFNAAASGAPAPRVQWQVSADAGLTFTDIAGATGTTLRFPYTTIVRSKEYRARFSNACGNNVATTAATLTLNSAPVVTLNPTDQTVCPGSVTFRGGASGTPVPSVQW